MSRADVGQSGALVDIADPDLDPGSIGIGDDGPVARLEHPGRLGRLGRDRRERHVRGRALRRARRIRRRGVVLERRTPCRRRVVRLRGAAEDKGHQQSTSRALQRGPAPTSAIAATASP